ncbi:hypothetical protein HDV05_002559 [Chytridiales sp. JEL 0842]|nr:hypothetical protein HDV05_002559 [Chytridiales sp. JEL 0842]
MEANGDVPKADEAPQEVPHEESKEMKVVEDASATTAEAAAPSSAAAEVVKVEPTPAEDAVKPADHPKTTIAFAPPKEKEAPPPKPEPTPAPTPAPAASKSTEKKAGEKEKARVNIVGIESPLVSLFGRVAVGWSIGFRSAEWHVLFRVEHMMSLDDMMAKYGVSVNPDKPSASTGLSVAEAAKRLEENGPNMLTPPKRKHPFLKFLEILLGLFNLLLIVSGILSFIILAIDYQANQQNTYLGSILIVIAFMNSAIEFFQAQKSQSILESFLNLIPAQCYVIRDGKQELISAKELVLGDLVFIRMGDKVPADIYLVHCTDLKVDNSSLTGEADPQERSKKNSHESPLEATNLVFNGTLAVNGEGYGIVIRTGDNTVIGQIASLTANEQRRESPLSTEIEHFVKIIAAVAAVVAIVFFIIALTAKGLRISSALNFAIGTFVSFVPEGLPATVTMLLTIAAKRMASRQVLVKDLQGVETLGAITLLATDKTGTLTRNQMTVTFVWSGLNLYHAQSAPNGVDNSVPLDLNQPGPNEVIHISALCCRAKFDKTDVPVAERQVIGDATEAGLIRCAAVKLPGFDTIQDTYPKVYEIPFNSSNKWAMTIHKKKHSNGELMLYIKGAPERILKLCNTIFDGTGVVPLTAEHLAKFDETYQFMASKGHRVLAFAALALPGDQYPADYEFKKDPINHPIKDFTFYGLVSLEDPPKHGVREAVGHCRAAGIKVMMVTGDHPLTAEAIGRKINLMLQDTKPLLAKKRGVPESEIDENEVRAIVIHGDTIDKLTEAEWNNIFSKEEIIFARTSPKHKLDIVKRAQGLGHIVGVTGDGVNDSPALKKADLGIAMNQSGSDVSKEAAAMILLDDNFASTVSGIEEGRLIFQNLKKSVQYTITHTMPEVFANLSYVIVPLPLPLSTIQILVVDLGFELFMALTYAYDPSENKAGLMKLLPRKPVNEESIARLKRRTDQERRELEAAGVVVDPEMSAEEQFKRMPRMAKVTNGFKKLFSGEYWKQKFEKTDDEILVDGDVLTWAYLEAGTIVSIGCFTAYFFAMWWHFRLTPYEVFQFAVTDGPDWGLDGKPFVDARTGEVYDRYNHPVSYGQSGFYLGIMFQQCFNLFICKARLAYPWGNFMWANKKSFLGMFVGSAFCFVIIYAPPLNVAFQTQWKLSPLVWLVPIAGGVVLYLYSILRTFIKRLLSPIKFSDEVVGLQMYPTRWSTTGR